jgi:class 3 adenylate cyclase
MIVGFGGRVIDTAGDGILAEFASVLNAVKCAAGMAGEDALAKAALQELRRVQLNISLNWVATQMPIKQKADREHYLNGLRRAGLV